MPLAKGVEEEGACFLWSSVGKETRGRGLAARGARTSGSRDGGRAWRKRGLAASGAPGRPEKRHGLLALLLGRRSCGGGGGGGGVLASGCRWPMDLFLFFDDL